MEPTYTLNHSKYFSEGCTDQAALDPSALSWSEMFIKEWEASFGFAHTKLSLLLRHNSLWRT